MAALWICMGSSASARCVSECTGATWEADGFCYLESAGAITIMAYTGVALDVVIPDTIDDMPVMYIGINAFRDCPNIKSVIFPSGLTGIGNNAFRDCPNLESAIFPEGLTQIDNNAFRGNSKLDSIYFLGDAPSTGANTFSGSSADCIIYYAPGALGFGETWRGYPTQEAYPPGEGEDPEDPVDPIEEPPVFLSEPLWVGPWVGLSSMPSMAHKPKTENILFWAFDYDRSGCDRPLTIRWKYRPVELVNGEALPTGEWIAKTPYNFLWWVWIENPVIADIPGPGLFEFKMTLQGCDETEIDSEQFWGKRYYFQVE